jgi:hypothetical protein
MENYFATTAKLNGRINKIKAIPFQEEVGIKDDKGNYLYRTFAEAYTYKPYDDEAYEPWMSGVWIGKPGTAAFAMIALHWEDLVKAKQWYLYYEFEALKGNVWFVEHEAKKEFGQIPVERSKAPAPNV